TRLASLAPDAGVSGSRYPRRQAAGSGAFGHRRGSRTASQQRAPEIDGRGYDETDDICEVGAEECVEGDVVDRPARLVEIDAELRCLERHRHHEATNQANEGE